MQAANPDAGPQPNGEAAGTVTPDTAPAAGPDSVPGPGDPLPSAEPEAANRALAPSVPVSEAPAPSETRETPTGAAQAPEPESSAARPNGAAAAVNTTLATRPVRPRKGRPFVFWKVWWLSLRDFFRSAWALLAVLVLAGLHFLLFDGGVPSQRHFFGVQYATVLVLGAVLSTAFFSRANRPEVYAILARPISRLALTGVLILAAWALTALGYLLSSAAVIVRYGPWFYAQGSIFDWLHLRTFLMGSIPILIGALLAVSVVALLSSFVTPSGVRLVVLAIIALLVMSFDSSNFPIEPLRPLLQELPPIVAPLADALRFATDSATQTGVLVSLGILAGYTLLLTLLVLLLSSGRETLLD